MVPIIGDISEPNLGIRQEDIKLITDNASVVFHLAATIKFDAPLRWVWFTILLRWEGLDGGKMGGARWREEGRGKVGEAMERRWVGWDGG